MFKTISYHYKYKNNKELKILQFLCHISKNVYNTALYELRKSYFDNGNIMSYFDLNKIVMKNINSHIINTYQTLCIDRCAYNSMNNFIRYSKYNKNVKIPKYLDKKGFYPLITDQIRILEKENKKCIKLPLSNLFRTKKLFNFELNDDSILSGFIDDIRNIDIKDIYFNIPKKIYDNKIHQIRIIPDKYGNYFNIEFSYSYDNKNNYKGIENKILGIDIGITNLASCITNDGKSFIIDGKYLKSLNVLYNKKIAKCQSKLPNGIYHSKMIDKLRLRRDLKINDYINKSVNEIVKQAKINKISKIIVGWNNGIKTFGIKNDELKKKDKRIINQQFVGLPLSKFKNKLIFKAKENNINIEIINESYTSKASALDNDEITKGTYSGKRITRGLYQTKDGYIINSDINAALNMIRKCNSNEINIQMSRGLTSPCRIYVRL
jgi:IS605 OrfB family transposase